MTSAPCSTRDLDDRAGPVTHDPQCGRFGEPALFTGLLGDRLGGFGVGDHLVRTALGD